MLLERSCEYGLSENSRASRHRQVPKRIHQTWKHIRTLPALSACIESVHFHNSAWKYTFYTDEDCLSWIEARCPEMLGPYLSYQTGIHRADFFRILVLYYEGGVYADIDVECLRPLDELISRLPAGKTLYLARDHPIHERVHFKGRAMWMNDFMIAAPGDPVLGEVIRWMVESPVTTGNSANAVLETGPGVLSSVIEMLGGPEMLPNLGVIPTPWVHPLPDMNCGFPEKHVYAQKIAQRSWLERETFVVHYWFHSWVGAKHNTLTDYADVLLSTLGEQVERKLQWLLGAEVSETDAVIAAALTEFAELRGRVRLQLGEERSAVVERFMEMLALSGLKPVIELVAEEIPAVWRERVDHWEAGGWKFRKASAGRSVGGETWSRAVLFVADSSVGAIQPDVLGGPDFSGLVLGPQVERHAVIAEAAGLFLSEILTPREQVAKVVHVLPGQGERLKLDGMEFFLEGFLVREWTMERVRELLSEVSLGTWNPFHLTENDQCVAAALAILAVEGGVVYAGNGERVTEHLGELRGEALLIGDDFWLLGCAERCPWMEGALRQWVGLRRRSRTEIEEPAAGKHGLAEHAPVDMPLLDFLRLRLQTVQRSGMGQRVKVMKVGRGAVGQHGGPKLGGGGGRNESVSALAPARELNGMVPG